MSEMLKAVNEQRMTLFDGLRIGNAARAASPDDVIPLTRANDRDQVPVVRSCGTVKPAPSNCGKSLVALLALRPRPDLRLAPGSIDLEVRTWDQPARPSHSGGRRRFPYWVGKLASVCIRSRFPSGLGPDRPRQSAFPAPVNSNRFPTRSNPRARRRRIGRQ
jgi:hypothetical protein